MKYLPENDLIVILGGWNPNILQDPNWVRKYLFDKKNPAATTDNGEMRYLTNKMEEGNVRLTMNVPKFGLGLAQIDGEGLDLVQQVAFNAADRLPHTPVNAFGINFAYETKVEENLFSSSPEIEKLLSAMPIDPLERKVGFTWSLDNYTLNVSLLRKSSETMRWDFNFHHGIESLDDFKGLIAERPLREYERESQKLIQSVLQKQGSEIQ